MSQQQSGPGPIPNRWLYCPRKSESIIAERFVAFKTPLSSAFHSQMPLECVFSPEMIFGYCKTLKLKLGLWIDLTNTKRFYNREVIDKNGAQYVKLQCRGHGETPSLEQTQAFIEIVDDFINERPLDLIAVHCTHGFNRTGFLIASYMVERLDCSVEAALAIFATARPPGIYKQDYINELFRRYEDEEDAIQAPELPAWCLEYDDSGGSGSGSSGRIATSGVPKRKISDVYMPALQQMSATQNAQAAHANGVGVEQDVFIDDGEDQVVNEADGLNTEAGGSGEGRIANIPHKKRRRELIVKNPTFMDGVPGISLVTDQQRLGELQRKVQAMCGWEKSGFPGTQPVSMDRKNIRRLHDIPYRVSWKADGTRYMMLINKRDEIYFFDRNNSCFQVENLSFVKSDNLNEHLEDTLLDGEMVLDKFQGQTTPRFLIYDIVRLSNHHIGKEPFYPNRLRAIKKELIDPRSEAIRRGIIDRPSEPFSVRNKEFWAIDQAAFLLGEKFAKRLCHDPDGLIFQPSKQPYTAGVCPDVLKWKPSSMNSVDFRLKIKTESGMGILPQKVGLLFLGGRDMYFAKMNCTRALRDLDNKIIECTLNSQGQWEFMRERTDKTLPNSYNTGVAVIESICHPVTKEILLEYIAHYGCRDDSDMMPPPLATQHMPRPPQPQHHVPQPQH